METHGRVGTLDGLRGLAILAVIAFHCDVLFGGQFGAPGNVLMSRIIGAGWVGVQLFFVLSGFLITTILLERKASGRAGAYFGGFYLRRVFRILPLYYGFLALYLVVLRRLPDLNQAPPIGPNQEASLFLFYYNLIATFRPVAILHMYWSLCIEEQFYLLWPLLVWCCEIRTLRKVSLGLAGLALVCRVIAIAGWHSISLAYLETPCVLDAVAIGSFVALLKTDRTFWNRAVTLSPWIGLGALLLVLSIAISQGHFYGNIELNAVNLPVGHDSSLILTVGITAVVILFGALLVLALDGDSPTARRVRRFLNHPALRSIGFYSYAMYMFHRVLFHYLEFVIGHLVPVCSGNVANLAKPLAIILLTAASYGAARVSYVLWESPFLRLRNRWAEPKPVMA